MDKNTPNHNYKTIDQKLSEDELKRLADLFSLLIQIDQRQKKEGIKK